MTSKKIISLAVLIVIFLGVTILTAQTAPFEIPVVVIKYFPVDGENIDKNITGDYGAPLVDTRQKVKKITEQIIEFLEDGSRFRAYRNENAGPSLRYKIVGTFEYLEPLPVSAKKQGDVFMTDYYTILERVDIKDFIENKGVKEVWLWGYHGGVIGLWESNMASKYRDVSNSDRDEEDLPVFSSTYTVYHYNYQRGLSEAIEDHMHQIEALLNHFDGRDTTDEDKWDQLLFWGKFVGSDISHKIIRPGCGWAHYPPNAEKDYDWKNENYVWSDIEDWKPDGLGKKIKMNCRKWNCSSLDWFKYWMQSLPGKDNTLKYKGKVLNNWWIFTGDFDYAKRNNLTLIEN